MQPYASLYLYFKPFLVLLGLTMVGELVASTVVDGLLSKLRAVLGSELELLWNFNDDLKDMKSTLESIRAVLSDAEKQSFKKKSVCLWLKRLKAAAYDIEDMLDKFQIQKNSKSQVIKSCNVNSCFSIPVMAHKLKCMKKRLARIAEERNTYHLMGEEKEVIEEPKISSVVFKDDVLGRDQEATQIINRLLMSTTTNESTGLSIIPIVGIGGLGKTTLAKLIYNDDRIKEVFEPRIWVHAMDFKVEKLVEAILSSSESENRNNLNNFDPKMTRAKKILQGKKYLIVLDDVWSEDPQKWEAFKQILQCGGRRESKIILTTRRDRVPSIMGAESTHQLQPLSDDDCLELFGRRAFESAGAKDKHLASIGEKIVKKCRGVPLTANSLGGMLHFEKREAAAWKKVLESDLWELKEEEGSGGSQSENKITSSLKLNYQHMPSALKLCFFYCSSYPRAFELDKDMLIQQWIAQRFIQTEDEFEALQIGEGYVNYLLSISFLEKEEKEYVIYKMHDLVYDIARWVAGDEVSDALESGEYNAMECRYASVIESDGPSKELGKALPRKVRALHFQDYRSLPKGIFSYTKYLRILDFITCSLDELPTSIYKLKQIRYLRLPDHLKVIDERIGKLETLESLIISNIIADHTLPTSIGKLRNLIHLDLSFSTGLLELPNSIGSLEKLHLLKLYGCHNLGSLPRSLANLMKLRTLDIQGCAMLDLDELPKAICNMRVRHLNILSDETLELFEFDTSDLMLHLINGLREGGHVVRHVTDAKRINLKQRGGSIKSLTYRCGGNKGRAVEAMLEALQPHQNLQVFRIHAYFGSAFPSWMMRQMESFLPNLVKITLENIWQCDLPVLGQLPKLEEIIINGMGKIRIISEEAFCGASYSFPSLKRLELRSMDELEGWVTARDDRERGPSLFPCLEDLTIWCCSKLQTVRPCIPPSVRKLTLSFNNHLVDVLEIPLLKHLAIYDYGLDSFAESIRRLTSLETLELRGCKSLTTFPEWLGELSQLQHLVLEDCPLIDRLPQSIQGLTALKRLRITECRESLLVRTRKETGEDWDKISHIDNVEIIFRVLVNWDKISHVGNIEITSTRDGW